jgi:uncharacterized protein YndB with AHSA1/START domain
MPDIRHLVTIRATPATIYGALTQQEGLAGWWTKQTVAEPLVGSFAEFRFGDRYYNKMRVTKLEPDSRVAWLCLEGDEQWIDTTFTFELEPQGDQTVLRFTHGHWRETTDFFASCNYHWGIYMRSLKAFCEKGQGDPFEADDA